MDAITSDNVCNPACFQLIKFLILFPAGGKDKAVDFLHVCVKTAFSFTGPVAFHEAVPKGLLSTHVPVRIVNDVALTRHVLRPLLAPFVGVGLHDIEFASSRQRAPMILMTHWYAVVPIFAVNMLEGCITLVSIINVGEQLGKAI